MTHRPLRRRLALLLTACGVAAVAAAPSTLAHPAPRPQPKPAACSPSTRALGYSDALDKITVDGAQVGGLSSLAFDQRSRAWVSAVDNHASDPARLWFFRDLAHPTVVRAPLVLRRPDGTPYTGLDSDNEGLAVLPDGRYLVSSETEPSIRIFGRDGVQRAALPVPARFAVAPAGEATSNATLEGLSISPRGDEIVAAMEGPLSGDVSPTDATEHRFLVYTADRRGRWTLHKQIAYRTDPGQRVPEVALYDEDSFVVEEASFDAATGNDVRLYAVTGLGRARDVSTVADLATSPGRAVRKTLLADLVHCPSLGAPALETQANPLLDNFEGLAVTTPRLAGGLRGLSLISDDNFSATQTTRVLNLVARLP